MVDYIDTINTVLLIELLTVMPFNSSCLCYDIDIDSLIYTVNWWMVVCLFVVLRLVKGTDRQIDTQTGRLKDRQTDRQTDRHTDRQTAMNLEKVSILKHEGLLPCKKETLVSSRERR